jgi:hypothetical protein
LTHHPDRDAELDRILRRFAGTDAPSMAEPSASGDCLDAETVAAMVDGGLLPHEQSMAVAHASTCPRCQALLAALIRTMPEPVQHRPWWRMPALQWLTPLAATGVAVAVWVAVGIRHPHVTPLSAPVQAPEKREEVVIPSPEEKATAATPAPRDSQAQSALGADREAPPGASPAPSAKRERAQSSDRIDQLTGARQKDEAPLEKAAAAGSAAPAPQATPPPPVPAPTPPTVASNVPVPAAPGAVMDRAANAVRSGAYAGRAPAAGLSESVLVSTDIRSSDPRARWRIVGASVQRSIDNGATWTVQETGTTMRLTAGSAPQPDVCWIVGDAGTVLLSVDGLTWQRLTPPVQTGLAAVTATSADAATVTTGDGRSFVTTDRGRTWQSR